MHAVGDVVTHTGEMHCIDSRGIRVTWGNPSSAREMATRKYIVRELVDYSEGQYYMRLKIHPDDRHLESSELIFGMYTPQFFKKTEPGVKINLFAKR